MITIIQIIPEEVLWFPQSEESESKEHQSGGGKNVTHSTKYTNPPLIYPKKIKAIQKQRIKNKGKSNYLVP